MLTKDETPLKLLTAERMVSDPGRLIANGPATFGIHHETLRKWARNSEADEGNR